MDYDRYSPYKNTSQTSWYLDIYNPIKIVEADDDEFFTIPAEYNCKPMAYAKYKYNSERLYYIFAITNPDIIKDPIYDFKVGVKIRVPTYERIQKLFGGV